MRVLNTTRARSQYADIPPPGTRDGTYLYDDGSSAPIVGYSGIPLVAPTEVTFESLMTADVVTENYAQRQAAGEIIMNDFHSKRRSIIYSNPGSVSATRGTSVSYSLGAKSNFSTYDVLGSDIFAPHAGTGGIAELYENEINLTLSRVFAKVGESELLLAATIGEASKTIKLVKSIFYRLLMIIKVYKKTRRLVVKGLLTQAGAASIYLECRYGIRPLVYELKGAVEALQNLGSDKRTRLFSKTEIPSSLEQKTFTANKQPGLSYVHDGAVIEDSTQAVITAGVVLEHVSPTKSTTDVFGLDEVLETAWELTPFSFIFDWFLNIGTWIDSWTPEHGVQVKGAWVTVAQTTERSATCYMQDTGYGFAYTYNPMSTHSQSGATSLTRVTEKVRWANPDRPLWPSWSVRLDALKITDILLIIGNISKSLRVY